MNDEEKIRTEIEIALRDSINKGLVGVSEQLVDMNLKAKASGITGGMVLPRLNQSTVQLGESVTATSRALGTMENFFEGFVSGLLGPGGVIGATALAGREMIRFAEGRTQLTRFATDIGLTAQQVQGLSLAMEKNGLTIDAAKSQISSMMSSMRDFNARGEASEFYKTLIGMNMQKVGDEMLKMTRSGDWLGAMDVLAKEFNSTGERFKTVIRSSWNLPNSYFESWSQARADLDTFKMKNSDVAEQAYGNWVRFKQRVYKSLENTAIDAYSIFKGKMQPSDPSTKLQVIVNTLTDDALTDAMKKLPENSQERDRIQRYLERRRRRRLPAAEKGKRSDLGTSGADDMEFSSARRMRPFPQIPESVKDRIREYKPTMPHWTSIFSGSSLLRFMKRDNESGHNAMRSQLREFFGYPDDPNDPVPWRKNLDEGGGGGPGEELIAVSRDSNKTLLDIRDILQKMEGGGSLGGIGGTGPGGYSAYGTGIRGGNMRAGLGGFRPFGGPSKLGPSAGSNTQEALHINSKQWDAYRQGLAAIESSGGKYGLTGGAGGRYSGAYQFGPNEIADTARMLGEPVPSRSQFLNDPVMQERYLNAYTSEHHRQLMKNPRYAALSPTEKLKVLAYAHNQGVGGANRFLNTGMAGRDAFGTSGASFSAEVGRRLSQIDYSKDVDESIAKKTSPRINAEINIKNAPSWVGSVVNTEGNALSTTRVSKSSAPDWAE